MQVFLQYLGGRVLKISVSRHAVSASGPALAQRISKWLRQNPARRRIWTWLVWLVATHFFRPPPTGPEGSPWHPKAPSDTTSRQRWCAEQCVSHLVSEALRWTSHQVFELRPDPTWLRNAFGCWWNRVDLWLGQLWTALFVLMGGMGSMRLNELRSQLLHSWVPFGGHSLQQLQLLRVYRSKPNQQMYDNIWNGEWWVWEVPKCERSFP